jgi:hypothetical protein
MREAGLSRDADKQQIVLHSSGREEEKKLDNVQKPKFFYFNPF